MPLDVDNFLNRFLNRLSDAELWYCNKDGNFIAYGDELDDRSETLTEEELVAWHPQLPHAMRALQEKAAREHMDYEGQYYASGHLVEKTAYYLRGDYHVRFSDVEGQAFYMGNIRDIQPTPNQAAYVTIQGTWVMVVNSGVEHEYAPIVTNCSTHGLNIARDEVNTLFPGWLDRWEVGQSLGLDARQLAEYTFPQDQSLVTPALPIDVTFDVNH